MEDFPQRKLFGAGDTPSAELPQARGHDYESVISTLLIVVCECSRLLSPNAAANGGREVGVFVGYCQSVVCRLNKRTSYTDYILAKKVTCHLVTYLK